MHKFQNQKRGASVTLGLLVTSQLKGFFNFISDPKLKYREVHTTCERCGISDCEARVASPLIIEQEDLEKAVIQSLGEL